MFAAGDYCANLKMIVRPKLALERALEGIKLNLRGGLHKAMYLNSAFCLRDKILKNVPPLSCLNATKKREQTLRASFFNRRRGRRGVELNLNSKINYGGSDFFESGI